MYVSWPAPLPDGGTGEEMALAFGKSRQHRLLITPPLFDESNKFRRQIVEIMRRLDLADIDSFCPDLPGCNESLAPQERQTLVGWRAACSHASEHFAATHVLALRAGCVLAPADLPGWLYAPAKPKQVLRSMVRARMLSSREAGHEESSEYLMEVARREGIELAGWQLGAALVAELETAELVPGAHHVLVEHGDIGGGPLWLRAEPDFDPAQADALAGMIAAGIDAS